MSLTPPGYFFQLGADYFDQGLQDGQHDRQYGGNRSDHQQPKNSNDLSAYRDGYKHGYRNIPTNEPRS